LPDALEQLVLVEDLTDLDHMLTKAMTAMSRRVPFYVGPAPGPNALPNPISLRLI
jgi:hypothetical protein